MNERGHGVSALAPGQIDTLIAAIDAVVPPDTSAAGWESVGRRSPAGSRDERMKRHAARDRGTDEESGVASHCSERLRTGA